VAGADLYVEVQSRTIVSVDREQAIARMERFRPLSRDRFFDSAGLITSPPPHSAVAGNPQTAGRDSAAKPSVPQSRPTQQAPIPPPPITNADVVELVRARISDEVIIAKIRLSQVNFDTSTSALIALKCAEV